MSAIEILALMVLGYWIGSFISRIANILFRVFNKKMEVLYRNEDKKLETKRTTIVGFTSSKKEEP